MNVAMGFRDQGKRTPPLRSLVAALLVLLSGLIATNPARGETIGPYSYLRKLSFHIRGTTPFQGEYDRLGRALREGKEERFWNDIIGEYLASNWHVYKMDYRLSELFFLKVNPLPIRETVDDSVKEKFNNFYYNNSLNSLFRNIAKKNLPWDDLLVGKEYEIFGPGTSYMSSLQPEFAISDFGFYGAVQPAVIPKVARGLVRKRFALDSFNIRDRIQKLNATFAENDPRIAGGLTTLRFFQRYPNSSTNKNRKRAQAVYRIFLCENMESVSFNSEENKQSLLNLFHPHARPSEGDGAVDLARPSTMEERSQAEHGKSISCKSCHHRLDPLGRAFMTSSLILSPVPSDGGILLQGKDGRERILSAKGLGELGKILVKQKEYVDCQISHFWKWFIGEDVTLSPGRLEELEISFNKLGRRTNDFIALLVKSDEFKNSSLNHIANESRIRAKTILDRCNSCHFYSVKEYIDYNQVLLKRKEGKNEDILQKLVKRLDLENDGIRSDMPPKSAKWKLDSQDRDALRDLLLEGGSRKFRDLK